MPCNFSLSLLFRAEAIWKLRTQLQMGVSKSGVGGRKRELYMYSSLFLPPRIRTALLEGWERVAVPFGETLLMQVPDHCPDKARRPTPTGAGVNVHSDVQKGGGIRDTENYGASRSPVRARTEAENGYRPLCFQGRRSGRNRTKGIDVVDPKVRPALLITQRNGKWQCVCSIQYVLAAAIKRDIRK